MADNLIEAQFLTRVDTLFLIPEVKGRAVEWVCYKELIQNKPLPVACRS